jgi:aspartyl-tRNA(Asn)/glutamyl-tRNA(Gln) amidotransferase subunit C
MFLNVRGLKPMSLVLEDVKLVANLARIKISDEEARTTLDQLTGIFYLIEQMQEVDTSTIIPMSHAQDVVQRLRMDVVTEADQHELFQSLAPQVEEGLYLVPKVIE